MAETTAGRSAVTLSSRTNKASMIHSDRTSRDDTNLEGTLGVITALAVLCLIGLLFLL